MAIDIDREYEKLENAVRAYNPNADFNHIHTAYEYARDKHDGQNRKDGSPYITHPLAVALIVADLHLDSESIMAALLHDCIEDTNATHEEIAKLFSPSVADLVEGVTKLTRVQYISKEEEQMENLLKMLVAMSKDIRVVLVKIADRLHNMRTMDYQTQAKQKQKSLETMEIYAPIAHRLGMQKVKWELEDLSLRYLDPIGYRDINDKLEADTERHETFMQHIQEQINERLAEQNIKATVYGRIKHTYSIYRKMYAQGKTLEQIYDLFAFRVIVDTLPDCYNVLGIMHDLYKPVLGRFKDYIGTPKPNMYQSLHTTVIGDEGIPFEVQIRTYEMHQIAEYGIAAHWKYKQGLNGKLGSEQNFEWVRKLLENQENSDAEEFIHNLKIDMFADEVFVFTPSGDVVNLPNGATPIDFAYSIHSAVGNSMTACKVNNRIVTFDYQLQNGDIVEVITSKAAHGPSRDWMNIARSNEARNKIRQWFKKERREENIARGKVSFDAELKRAGIPLSVVTADENLPLVLKKVSYASLDEMYAAIGYGGVSSLKVVNKVHDELIRIAKSQQSSGEAEDKLLPINKSMDAPSAQLPKPRHSENGIIVEGLDNCLVKFSKCCSPVPGDPIIGFITRGYGVSVHRCDCPNADPETRPDSEKGRWIKVSWADDAAESYQTNLEIISKDRDSLVLDICTMLSAAKIRVVSFSSRGTPDGYAITSIAIQVSGSMELSQLMKKLNNIQGVMQVKRPAG